jgi:flagellar biogenesis protein FliO
MVCVLSLVGTCLAQSAPTTTPAGFESTPILTPAPASRPSGPEGGAIRRDIASPLDDWGRTVLALAVVLLIILGLRFVLKKLSRRVAGPRGGAVEVLSRTSLQPRHQLLLVRMGRRLLLIGAGPAGLTTLSEVSDPEEVAELSEAAMGENAEVLAKRPATLRPKAGQTPEAPDVASSEGDKKDGRK